MQKTVLQIILSLFLLTLVMLSSCKGKVETIRILTDRKELASAVEIFDTANDRIIISLHHVPMIDAEMIEAENPDLIIGSYLSSSEIVDLLRPSESEFPVYQALTGPLDEKGRRILVPLSFELPLIIGRKETLSELPDSMVIQPGELKEAAAGFTTRNNDGRLIRLGYSPSWNLLSFTDLLAIRAPDFFTGGMDHLNEAILSQVVEESREWINESAGDSDSDISFNERYRYIPDEYLLIDNRILFARSNFENWAFLPDEITRKLDFRYLSGPRKIPVIAVLSAGIPRKSSSPEAASLFIQWLLQPETQALLIKRWERDGINVFGFLGGLSSIPEVNESILTQHNPLLKSMVPEGHYLQVPDNRPLRWLRIRDEVVIPWYQSVIYRPENVPSLSEAFEKWDLSSLAETK